MSAIDVAVLIGALALIVVLLWFFFGPRTGKAAAIRAGVQEVTIRVEGAYQPSVVTVKAGLPVRLRFDRREERSNRVVFPEFHISRAPCVPGGDRRNSLEPDRLGRPRNGGGRLAWLPITGAGERTRFEAILCRTVRPIERDLPDVYACLAGVMQSVCLITGSDCPARSRSGSPPRCTVMQTGTAS